MKYFFLLIIFLLLSASNCFSHLHNPNDENEKRKHNLEPYTDMSDFLKRGAEEYCSAYYGVHRPKQEGCILKYIKDITDGTFKKLFTRMDDLYEIVSNYINKTESPAVQNSSNGSVVVMSSSPTEIAMQTNLRQTVTQEFTTPTVAESLIETASRNIGSAVQFTTQSSDGADNDWIIPVVSVVAGVVLLSFTVLAYKKGWIGKALSYCKGKTTSSNTNALYFPGQEAPVSVISDSNIHSAESSNDRFYEKLSDVCVDIDEPESIYADAPNK